jgi:group I intron endonuclease
MYIYKVTNNINGKVYIGQSTKSIDESSDYYGSGLLIKHAIKKYGIENFTKDILCECISIEELNDRERFYINQYDSVNIGYNISIGGNGGDLGETVNNKISETVKRRWDEGCYSHIDWASVLSNRPVSEETKRKISLAQSGENGYWYGKKFSDLHRLNIKNNTQAAYENGAYENLLEAMRSDEVRKKISESLIGNVPWNKGKTSIYTEETLQKMSDSAKSRNIVDENEKIRRLKISEYFSKNHPNRIEVIDTRTNTTYDSVKSFCDTTSTSYYIFKKLKKTGEIRIFDYSKNKH